MNSDVNKSLPIIDGPHRDIASAFLGPTPDLISAVPINGGNVYAASGDARQIVGNVITTFTGTVERVELHVTDTVSNNLGLSSPVASATSIYDQVAEVLQSQYEDLSLSIPNDLYEGTCSWILTHKAYTKWYNDSSTDFLWLCGPPGCGKTTISLFLLRSWRDYLQNSHSIVHFFFSRQLEKAKTPQNFLAAFLHQIIQLYPLSHRILKDLPGLKAIQSVASLTSSYEGLWNILNQILISLHSISAADPQKPLLCIIDALEECTDTSSMQFLRRLHKDLYASPFPIKIIVTCRREYIERIPPFVTAYNIIKVDEENFIDIHKYVAGHLRLWSPSSLESDTLHKLEMEITSRAEGIFLWAALIIEGLLQRGTRIQTILDTIYTFPRGRDRKLRRVYEEILKQASADLEDELLIADVQLLLSTVITAATPLTLQELEECLEASGIDSQRLDLERDVQITCRGLLKVEMGYVKPFHITLKAYLENATECLPQFYIDQDHRHIRMAESCLRYAVDRISLAGSDQVEEIETVIAENAFLAYAATQWPYHIIGCKILHHELVKFVHDLLGSMKSFRKWYTIILTTECLLRQQLYLFRMACGDAVELLSLSLEPAHMLSLVGLPRPFFAALFQSNTIAFFSEQALGLENKDGQGRIAAHWASALLIGSMDPTVSIADEMAMVFTNSLKPNFGSQNAAALSHILQVFPNSSQIVDQTGKSPLHFACLSCNTPKVQMLLDAKADIQLRDKSGFSPLHYSCGPLNAEAAKLLLSYNTSVDTRTNEGFTPLHIAALHGQEQTVKRLLDHGANVEAETNDGITPLHFAVLFGKDYAQVFVSQMIQNEVLITEEKEPLEWLSSVFNSLAAREKTIKRLIAAGADQMHSSVAGETALFIAAHGGHLGALKTLISSKPSLDMKNSDGWTSLFAAAFMGQELVVEALINAGADIHLGDHIGNTPLHMAAQNGHRLIAALLISAGADINLPNAEGFTPLHAAASTNLAPMISFRARQNNVKPDTIPFISVFNRRKPEVVLKAHEDIAKDLLIAGVTIDAADREGVTALHVAAFHGSEAIVRSITDHGTDPNLMNKSGTTHIDINSMNKFGATPMFMAALAGNKSCLETLLEKGADIKTSSPGITPLHAGVQMGHESIVKILIDAGAEVDCLTEEGNTPIHCLVLHDFGYYMTPGAVSASSRGVCHGDAAELVFVAAQKDREWEVIEEGQQHCLEILLSKGAEVNLMDSAGYTALCRAAGLGRESIARILLQHGADPNIPDPDGHTPLFTATLFGHNQVVKLLLQHGADPKVKNKEGDSVLLAAANDGSLEAIKLLLEYGADLRVTDRDGCTSLHTAVAANHLEVVKLLLDRGVDISAVDNCGWTPLLIAIDQGHFELVKVLLEKGADISIPNDDGWTPLLFATARNQPEVVQLLLEKNAHVQGYSARENTPLHIAAREGYIEMVKLLLKQENVDLDPINVSGYTPLMEAARNGCLEIVQILVEHAADSSITDDQGWTPINAAVSAGHTQVVKALLDAKADASIATKKGWSPIHIAAFAAAIDIVTLLLDAGIDPNTRGPQGWTPVLGSATKGNIELVQLLSRYGAVMNSKDDFGLTNLHHAVIKGHSGLTQWLIDHGAEVDATDNSGRTPLMEAVTTNKNDIVTQLLEAKANPMVRTKTGLTSQHIAANGDQVELLQLLETKGALLDVVDDYECSLLHYAAKGNACSVLKFLILERKQDPSISDSLCISPLHKAVYSYHLEAAEVLMQAKSDPKQIDGHGRTCLDWAKSYPAMFKVLSRGDDEYTPPPQDVSKTQVLSSLRTIFEKADRGVQIRFYELGHCFLRLADEDAACISFEQQIFPSTNNETLAHSVVCNMCSTNEDIKGRRYVCVECADVDLCESCMQEYEEKNTVPGCKGHRFLTIPGPSWTPLKSTDSEDPDVKARTRGWMDQMKQKYLGTSE